MNNADEIIGEMIAFSLHSVEMANDQIIKHKTFLAFGATLSLDYKLSMVVYEHGKEIDPREQATIIQKIIQERWKEPTCHMIYIAFDGTAHLKTGDVDAISVRVGHKPSGIFKTIVWPYKVVSRTEGLEVEIIEQENPIIIDN